LQQSGVSALRSPPSEQQLRQHLSTDFLLGRVAKPELAAEADRLHRDAQRLNDQDRGLAQAFIEMLGKRAKKD
jgi:hypothetical protein